MIPIISTIFLSIFAVIISAYLELNDLQTFLVCFSLGVFGAVVGIMLETWDEGL